ncbi:hypothetical protein L208DRAFT_1395061 [Tricholoma matsutake]|nr:hypothetical protein L208DRAFT_1395061 [Tricholoma matsutake 945]
MIHASAVTPQCPEAQVANILRSQTSNLTSEASRISSSHGKDPTKKTICILLLIVVHGCDRMLEEYTDPGGIKLGSDNAYLQCQSG